MFGSKPHIVDGGFSADLIHAINWEKSGQIKTTTGYLPSLVDDCAFIYQVGKKDTTTFGKTVFVVATKSGVILNDPASPMVQLPKSGYLGRYLIHQDGVNQNGHTTEYRFDCSYWTRIEEIRFENISSNDLRDNQVAVIKTILPNELPTELREKINASGFFDQYLDVYTK